MFMLELSVGQFLSVGGLGIFQISPIFKVNTGRKENKIYWIFSVDTFNIGSRLCCGCNGLLAERLLHRGPQLGTLLLLLFLDFR